MKKMKVIMGAAVAMLAGLSFASTASATSSLNTTLNTQIGNGAAYSCNACHVGGVGQKSTATLPMAITANNNGNMASSDSDADGFTNLQEFLAGGSLSTNLDFNLVATTPFTAAVAAEGSTSTKVAIVGGGVATEVAITDPYTQYLVTVPAVNEIAGSVAVTVAALPATVWFPKAIPATGSKAHVVVDGATPAVNVTADMTVNANGSVTLAAGTLTAGDVVVVEMVTPVVAGAAADDDDSSGGGGGGCIAGSAGTPLMMLLGMLAIGFMVRRKRA